MWTLPKGVRIPVSLNTSGEPVGKEASTLSNFLSAIARDGILAPLIYQDWRRVPEKNKDIIWRIVKPSEDPINRLEAFQEICVALKASDISDDDMKLRDFSLSLKDKAKDWYYSLAAASITSWAALKKKFQIGRAHV